MVIIIGSPKPVIVSRTSETHCGPAKIDFGWPDWPAREKVKHDPWSTIKNLKTNSAPGPDGMTCEILATCAPVISEPLTALFSKSLSEGCVPNLLKRVAVVSIF